MLLPVSTTVAKSPQHAQAIAAQQKKIDAALQSGATGPKGFLIWVRAAWPKPIADKIIAAAAKHQAKSKTAALQGPLGRFSSLAKVGLGYSAPNGSFMSLSQAARARRFGMGAYSARSRNVGMGSLGDVTDTSGILADVPAITIAPDTTDPTVANSSTSAASPSWLSSMSTAVTSAVQGYLGIQQAKDAQTLFNTNLARAQAGLAPLNANPSAYGITQPTVNVGLSPGVQSMLLYGGIGVGLLFLLNIGMKAAKKS